MTAIAVYRSAIIPDSFLHGFPERYGGVSQGLRSSLNLGFRWGDNAAHVEQNRQILAAFIGYPADALQVTKHVHGTNVWRVGEPLPAPPEFDGLVTDRAGPVLGAFAADCMPIVFADPDAKVAGACHAGWRGTVDGVAENVVARMIELGALPSRIRVAIGPSIGPCCFEVGPEVVAQFETKFGIIPGVKVPGPSWSGRANAWEQGSQPTSERSGGGLGLKKDHLNLRLVMRHALQGVGLAAAHIDDQPPCTKCNPERFFSYRRDGIEGGVHMGFIAIR
jgi:polyphenol oxidase